MAKLIDAYRLIDSPRNVPMYIERRGEAQIVFEVAWRYDEKWHTVGMLGGHRCFDIDTWNWKWRAWDSMPTKKEREKEPWFQEEKHEDC